MQTKFQLGNYTHTCTNDNETHSVANILRFNPYFGWFVLLYVIMSAKVGIKSCRFAGIVLLYLHVLTQIVAYAACRVGSLHFC